MTLAHIIKPERKARSCPESRANIAIRKQSLMRRPVYMRKRSLMRTPFPYELTEAELNDIVRTLEENNLLRGALKSNRNYSNVAGRTRYGRCARKAGFTRRDGFRQIPRFAGRVGFRQIPRFARRARRAGRGRRAKCTRINRRR